MGKIAKHKEISEAITDLSSQYFAIKSLRNKWEWKGNDKARKALSDASDALKFAIASLSNESIASSFGGEEIRVLSLFSGIGAFEAALKRIRVPFSLVGYCEIDRFASKSYSAIHGVPESMNLRDVRKVDGKSMDGKVDLLTYGFPCQDISVAGKMAGFEKDGKTTRSGLFFEALRIIQECKPRIAIAENVKNLTSKRFEKEFATVLRSLEEAGYRNYWKVLNARDYGIPQNRERESSSSPFGTTSRTGNPSSSQKRRNWN